MESKLVEILEKLQFDVILQGTLDSTADYPDSFFSYWNLETPRESFYDNRHSRITWVYQIVAYSNDRATLLDMTTKAIETLEENGFIIDGESTDIASDLKSHTGKIIEATYIEVKGGN